MRDQKFSGHVDADSHSAVLARCLRVRCPDVFVVGGDEPLALHFRFFGSEKSASNLHGAHRPNFHKAQARDPNLSAGFSEETLHLGRTGLGMVTLGERARGEKILTNYRSSREAVSSAAIDPGILDIAFRTSSSAGTCGIAARNSKSACLRPTTTSEREGL